MTYLLDQFEAKHKDETVEEIAELVGARLEEKAWENGFTGHNVCNEDTLAERVTMAIGRKFEEKLEALASGVTSLKFSDEAALADIVADRVQEGLKDSLGKFHQEADAAFKVAEEVTLCCEQTVIQNKERMERLGERLHILMENTSDAEGTRSQGHGGSDRITNELGSIFGQRWMTQRSFANTLRVGAGQWMDRVSNAGSGNILRAPHAYAIHEAEASTPKFVLHQDEDADGISWLVDLSERELVQRANEALNDIGMEGDRDSSTNVKFISAKRIPGGALLYMATTEGTSGSKKTRT